jgi:SAM-dependent methyltransferase
MKLFRKSDRPAFLNNITKIFGHRVRKYGNTPKGVLWKNSEGQQLRFEILAAMMDDLPPAGNISINDFGCGYGALFDFLCDLPSLPEFTYTGFDMSTDMIVAGKKRFNDTRATFKEAIRIDTPADFTFVSGTFNLKNDTSDNLWNEYIKSNLRQLWSMTSKGMAFNMLDKARPDRAEGLYYADAIEFLDFCSEFSGDVTLSNDYPLHEWTIFIRR